MQYKIIVDKQSRTNPSADKKEYTVNIEELRTTGSVSDSLVITKDEAYVLRRLKLTEYRVLEELENPVKQTLENTKIELFEGDNYIYLIDMVGNKFYAEYVIKNDLTDMYATKLELTTAINQTAAQIQLLATQKLNKDELSTELQVNYEAVKIAWNKITDYIQMMITNNNASFAILDQNKKILMTLDKTGQHFYQNNGTDLLGSIGVDKDENSKTYLNFAADMNYGENTSTGMAWGAKTPDGKFHPIMYLKNYNLVENGSSYGQLELANCDLILIGSIDEGSGGAVQCGDILMGGSALNGLKFIDADGNNFLNITKGDGTTLKPYDMIEILEDIIMYKNSLGVNCLGIGKKYSNGQFSGTEATIASDGYASLKGLYWGSGSSLDSGGTITCSKVYETGTSSDRRIKENIKDSTISALDIIKKIQHKEFDKKDDGKHYKIGYIAQEMEQIDPNFVIKRPADKNIEERYYINELPIIATLTKAIQEQQKQIEELKQRIENLEKGEENGNT